jgi:hypothetical protein
MKDSRQRLHQRVHQVQETYRHPPKLHCRFPPITKVPLHERLIMTTTHLQCWLSRLSHPIEISKVPSATKDKGQLTLKQAYRGACIDLLVANKYPPPP